MSMIRSVVQAAVAVAAMLIAYPAVAQVTNDPFPDPIPASEGVIVVGLEEFAALPDVDGAPARALPVFLSTTCGASCTRSATTAP